MGFKSGRGKNNIICASILIGALFLFGFCLAAASILNSTVYTPYLLNALKTADRTAAYYEAPRVRLRDWVNSASQLCVHAFSDLNLFEGRSEIVLYARTAGTIFETPEHMVLRE